MTSTDCLDPADWFTGATCTKTHAEHSDTWRSWRDDCIQKGGCGFAVRDIAQCDAGHPDDGAGWCGACGWDAGVDQVRRGEHWVATTQAGLRGAQAHAGPGQPEGPVAA